MSAVVGIVVLYLLWSNNNLQYELESSEFAKHSLTEDLIETKARHTQAEVKKIAVVPKIDQFQLDFYCNWYHYFELQLNTVLQSIQVS